MRPLEILLTSANVLACLVLVTPTLRATPAIHLAAPLALLGAALQLRLEGRRPQLVPAYTLAGLVALLWIAGGFGPELPPALDRWRELALGVGGLLLLISVALPLLQPVFRFARPSGPYAAGTLSYHLIDPDRRERFSADPAARRELMAQVWYPAAPAAPAPRAPYLPDAAVLTAAFARVHRKPPWLLGHLRAIAAPAIPSAPVAGDRERFPVLLFLAGATGFRQMNTFQVVELVSHGYIVVALDQPYTAAAVVLPGGRAVTTLAADALREIIRPSYMAAVAPPLVLGQPMAGGSVIPYLAEDVRFMLDWLAELDRRDPQGILAGRLDLEHVGIFGVSLGGIVAAEVCRLDPRLSACLMLDAPMPLTVVAQGLPQPSMWITRDAATMRLERRRAGGWPEDEIAAHLDSMRAVFEGSRADGYYVQVPGIFHSNFTDIPLWSPAVRWLGLAGPLDARRAHRIVNSFTRAFFDRYLKGLAMPASPFPEVSVEMRLCAPAAPDPALSACSSRPQPAAVAAAFAPGGSGDGAGQDRRPRRSARYAPESP